MPSQQAARIEFGGHPTGVRSRWLLAGALLGAALMGADAVANGADLPAPLQAYEAEYRVARGPLTLGRSVTRLRAVSEGWEYRTVVTATGVARMLVSEDAVERTIFDTDGTSLRTLRYEHRPPDKVPALVDFDWAGHQALIDNDDGDSVVPLTPGQHDPHGAILSVMVSLARDGDVPDFEVIDDDGDVRALSFEVGDGGEIRVPFGRFDTVKVTRDRADRDRQLIAWFAPELDWLPIRIQQVNEGSTVARMELRTLNGDSGSGRESRSSNPRNLP